MNWDFIMKYLVEDLGVVHVVAGHDFHFGYMGKGNPRRLQEMCGQLGIGCDIIGKIEEDGITVLDFKTDRVTEGPLEDAVQRYRPQVLTYAEALSRIYEMPVKGKFLYFFRLDRFVEL